MEQINVKAKKWGNSIGIVLPKFIVEKENINEGTNLVINVKSRNRATAGDLIELSKKLGLQKKLKNIDTQKALKKIDEIFWPE